MRDVYHCSRNELDEQDYQQAMIDLQIHYIELEAKNLREKASADKQRQMGRRARRRH